MSKSPLVVSKAAQAPPSTPTQTSASTTDDIASGATLFPTETEIYILPDGRVIVADMPAELAALVATLGDASSDQTNAGSGWPDPARNGSLSALPSKGVDPDQNH